MPWPHLQPRDLPVLAGAPRPSTSGHAVPGPPLPPVPMARAAAVGAASVPAVPRVVVSGRVTPRSLVGDDRSLSSAGVR